VTSPEKKPQTFLSPTNTRATALGFQSPNLKNKGMTTLGHTEFNKTPKKISPPGRTNSDLSLESNRSRLQEQSGISTQRLNTSIQSPQKITLVTKDQYIAEPSQKRSLGAKQASARKLNDTSTHRIQTSSGHTSLQSGSPSLRNKYTREGSERSWYSIFSNDDEAIPIKSKATAGPPPRSMMMRKAQSVRALNERQRSRRSLLKKKSSRRTIESEELFKGSRHSGHSRQGSLMSLSELDSDSRFDDSCGMNGSKHTMNQQDSGVSFTVPEDETVSVTATDASPQIPQRRQFCRQASHTRMGSSRNLVSRSTTSSFSSPTRKSSEDLQPSLPSRTYSRESLLPNQSSRQKANKRDAVQKNPTHSNGVPTEVLLPHIPPIASIEIKQCDWDDDNSSIGSFEGEPSAETEVYAKIFRSTRSLKNSVSRVFDDAADDVKPAVPQRGLSINRRTLLRRACTVSRLETEPRRGRGGIQRSDDMTFHSSVRRGADCSTAEMSAAFNRRPFRRSTSMESPNGIVV